MGVGACGRPRNSAGGMVASERKARTVADGRVWPIVQTRDGGWNETLRVGGRVRWTYGVDGMG